MRSIVASSLALTAALAGCPVENDLPDPIVDPAQCLSSGYTAFDVANHAEQDARTQAHVDIMELLEEGVDDEAVRADRFAAASAIYASTAELQGKVEGRTDDHLQGKPNVGAEIDARIQQAFVDGGAATTTRDADIAAETVNISLIEFFFLSVFHEMVQGQAAKWDEAFGYFGSGADNSLDGVRGFALVARDIDEEAGTALEARMFQGIVDGSCTLATKLAEQDVETIDVLNDADMKAHIDEVDAAARLVLANFAIVEATEIEEKQEELEAAPGDQEIMDEMRVELHELNLFFLPLERLLRAEGDTAVADAVRGPVDEAFADDTNAWVDTFDAAGVIETLRTHFEIE
jgi:hypothetical protein